MKEGINIISLICNVILVVAIFTYVVWTEDTFSLRISEWKCSETIASGTEAVCLSYERVQPATTTTQTK